MEEISDISVPEEITESIEQIDHIESVEQIDQIESVEQIDQNESVEQIDQTESLEQIEQIESVEQIEQTESAEQIDKSAEDKGEVQAEITESPEESKPTDEVEKVVTEPVDEQRMSDAEEVSYVGMMEKPDEAEIIEDSELTFDVDAVVITSEVETVEDEIVSEEILGEVESGEEIVDVEKREVEPVEALEDIEAMEQTPEIEEEEEAEEASKEEIPSIVAPIKERKKSERKPSAEKKSLVEMLQEKRRSSRISKGAVPEAPGHIRRSAIQESISAVAARSSVSSEDEEGIMEATTIEPKIDDYTLAKRSKHRYANSYQLKPSYNFQVDKVTSIIQELLNQVLTGRKYDRVVAMQVARELSGVILNKVKHLGYHRHKFVSIVYVGQKKSQSITLVSSGLWDAQYDNFASATFDSCEIFAIGCLFATYYE